jgi:hypothetical protein
MRAESIGLLGLDAAPTNENIARAVVERIKNFRTTAPLGATWESFAVSEVLLALNNTSRLSRGKRRKVELVANGVRARLEGARGARTQA